MKIETVQIPYIIHRFKQHDELKAEMAVMELTENICLNWLDYKNK